MRITIDSILSGSSSGTNVAAARSAAQTRARVVAAVGCGGRARAGGLAPRASGASNRDQLDPVLPPQSLTTLDVLPARTRSLTAAAARTSLDGVARRYASWLIVASPRPPLSLTDRQQEPEARPIPGTEPYQGVRGSRVLARREGHRASSRSLNKQLMRMPVAGGMVQRSVMPRRRLRDDWGEDGIILFGQGRHGIWRGGVTPAGARRIASVEPGRAGARAAAPSRRRPFPVHDRDRPQPRSMGSAREIVVQSLNTGMRTKLRITRQRCPVRGRPRSPHLRRQRNVSGPSGSIPRRSRCRARRLRVRWKVVSRASARSPARPTSPSRTTGRSSMFQGPLDATGQDGYRTRRSDR